MLVLVMEAVVEEVASGVLCLRVGLLLSRGVRVRRVEALEENDWLAEGYSTCLDALRCKKREWSTNMPRIAGRGGEERSLIVGSCPVTLLKVKTLRQPTPPPANDF